MSNEYAYCTGCGFGIEVSTPTADGTRSEYVNAKGECFTCANNSRPRSVPMLKRLLADSEVLLRSAQRVSDLEAIAFYSHQVAKCKEALGDNAPQEAQRSLF